MNIKKHWFYEIKVLEIREQNSEETRPRFPRRHFNDHDTCTFDCFDNISPASSLVLQRAAVLRPSSDQVNNLWDTTGEYRLDADKMDKQYTYVLTKASVICHWSTILWLNIYMLYLVIRFARGNLFIVTILTLIFIFRVWMIGARGAGRSSGPAVWLSGRSARSTSVLLTNY